MAFNNEHLKLFFEKERAPSSFPIDNEVIFVALTPNAGVTIAETAIVSFFMSADKVVIVGMDAHPTTNPQQPRQILYAHLDALHAQPRFSGCKFVLIPEATYGNDAQVISQILLRRGTVHGWNVEVLCQYGHNYGVFTTPADVCLYVMSMREKLAQNNLWLNETLVDKSLCNMLDKLQRQMASLQMLTLEPRDHQQLGLTVFTSNIDADGKRKPYAQDDVCMTLLMGQFFAQLYTATSPLVIPRTPSTPLLDSDHHLHFEAEETSAPSAQIAAN